MRDSVLANGASAVRPSLRQNAVGLADYGSRPGADIVGSPRTQTMKRKKLSLAKLQEAARVATQIALASRVRLPDHVRAGLTLGTFWEQDSVVFELYLPKERPSDAVVLTKARINSYDGRVEALISNP